MLRAITGQLRLRSGELHIGDRNATKWPAFQVARSGVRWVGEPRPLVATLTVQENLEIGGITRRGDLQENMEKLWTRLPLLYERRHDRAGSLSGGQQQLLAIGQAMMSQPTFLCLDEPSLGLAPQVIVDVGELIDSLVAQGVGVLWAEQFPRLLLEHCSIAIVMHAGSIAYAGPASELSDELLEAAFFGEETRS
jgi:branched-chain amino acid transport system ATP-binding protein